MTVKFIFMLPILFIISLVVAVVISASLILILIYYVRSQKETKMGKKSTKLLPGFDGAATEFGLSITKRASLRNGEIGLDEENNKVLFLTSSKNKEDGFLVDLEDIKSCVIKKTFAPHKVAEDPAIKTIELQLNFKNGRKPILLPFYDLETEPKTESCRRIDQAIQWQTMLSARLTKRRYLNGFHSNQNEAIYLRGIKRIA